MKTKCAKLIKSVIALTIFATIISTTSFAAAWWGLPGYEWAKARRLTTLESTSTLNNKVSHANFYTILINYLHYKNVKPKTNIIQNVGSLKSFNKALDGIVKDVDTYISKTSLSPQEYRNVDTYITHISRVLDEQKVVLNRDNLKEVQLYMDIARYKAATLIDDDSYREYILARISHTKYSELVRYNIRPYFGDITRREFLVLMFSLLSDRNVSQEEIINEFYEAGVLRGVSLEEVELALNKELTYAEMMTFLMRFENFDFNPVKVESSAGEGSSSGDGDVFEIK